MRLIQQEFNGAGETMEILPATAEDLDEILTINNAAVPHVNHLSRRKLAGLVRQSVVFRKACGPDGIGGFLLALDHTAVYPSENYQWFVGHLERFMYIDRVAVRAEHRGQGVGQALYHDLFQESRRLHHERVACEVNVHPPNPLSMQFHLKLGFEELGQLRHVRDEKVVALLAVRLRA